ncbi:anion transporter [Bacillus pakistanensis]|uniref:Sodium-dependent dicarboxylate transporter SdcS n=1 Tax=Rossellomorea pakistanensis TaxID=992288 RepID=A0ABS2NCS3_9BACI|nr:SLC13 family permease [Bacillus pakistanensis]MBM7585643.1 anion transporter [Bacillus pakistanensis]
MNNKRILLGFSLLLYLMFFFPCFDWDIRWKAVIALAIIQILWIGRVFPLAFSSLLFMLILSFHFFSYEETLGYFSSGIVWLLFSTFILSKSFIETGLASRVSLFILKLSAGSGKALILISFLLMIVLSILIPSNVGKASLVSSVLDSLVKSLKQLGEVRKLAKSLFIGIAYLAAISGVFVATGASSTIYTFGILSEISPDIDYLNWLILFGVPILLYILLLWIIFLVIFPPEKIDRKLILNFIDDKIKELGKLSVREKKLMILIGFTLLLWITQNWHGYSIPQIGLLGACITILPYIGIWNWEQARKSIDWDMMLFFASTLMVSGMLVKTGTIDWMASVLNTHLSAQSTWLAVLILVIFTAILRIVFVNILGFLTIMLPLAVTIGETMPDVSPITIAMPVFLAGVPGFFLVTQSPVHLISYTYSYFSDKDLFRVGVYSAFLWIVVILFSVFFWWS